MLADPVDVVARHRNGEKGVKNKSIFKPIATMLSNMTATVNYKKNIKCLGCGEPARLRTFGSLDARHSGGLIDVRLVRLSSSLKKTKQASCSRPRSICPSCPIKPPANSISSCEKPPGWSKTSLSTPRTKPKRRLRRRWVLAVRIRRIGLTISISPGYKTKHTEGRKV